MRLSATIDLHLPGEAILRSPTFWERLRHKFGGTLDLETDRARVAFGVTALVDQVRAGLKRIGVDNAVSLVVDEQVVFSDTEGKPGDLPELVDALGEHARVFGTDFRSVRLAVEHEEAGLHAVLEIQVRAEHRKSEPTAAVRVGARIRELEARIGETAEQYRDRVKPLVENTALLEGHRRQFDALVARLVDALRAAFPEGRVTERPSQAQVVKPGEGRAMPRPEPGHPAYDPYLAYYPSPFESMLSSMLITSFLMSAMHPPHDILVVHPSGAPIGHADDLGSHQAELSADAPDPGFSAEPVSGGDDLFSEPGAGEGFEGDFGGDAGGGGFDGGGFDGGDLGGGDFGGGDFGGGWD